MKKIILSLIFVIGSNGVACTSFLLDQSNSLVFGNNYDWFDTQGIVVKNPRGLHKKALLLKNASQPPVTWQSKYGSITINQVSWDFPNIGVNEAGLIAAVMQLRTSQYPDNDNSTPTVNESQWLQMQLDLAKTTSEAVEIAKSVKVQPEFTGLHYLICDKQAKCATFEYVNKNLEIHESSSLPFNVLANSTYAESLTYLKDHVGFGGKKPIPVGEDSLDRFTRATFELTQPLTKNPVDRVIEILAAVKQSGVIVKTRWTTAIDLKNLKLYFKPDGGKLNSLDFNQMNFDSNSKIEAASFENLNFVPYSAADNQKFVNQKAWLTKSIKEKINWYSFQTMPN